MLRTKQSLVLLGVIVMTAMAGCGKKAPNKVSVSGTVTIDGKAPSGDGFTLSFAGADGGGSSIEVASDGTFSGEAVSGMNTVELIGGQGGHGAEKSGEEGDSMYSSKYAAQTVEVTSDGKLTIDFKTGGASGTGGGH